MAETKVNFIKSKMNKDLDDRLLGNGEYREGVNIAVNKSEDSDVGALENVLGNFSIAQFENLTNQPNLTVIGRYMDYTNNRIFVFLTNYTDSSSGGLSNYASIDSGCFIVSYNLNTDVTSTLVSGRFLNFSKNSPIYGVNMIEDLLFWTDNRNQPRKINVTRALADSSYYNNEDHISVAKYYPYKPLRMYRKTKIENSSVSNISAYQCDLSTANSNLNNINNLKKGDYIVGLPGQVSKVQILEVKTAEIVVNYGTRTAQPEYDTNIYPSNGFDFFVISAAGKDKANEFLPQGLPLHTEGNTNKGYIETGDTSFKIDPLFSSFVNFRMITTGGGGQVGDIFDKFPSQGIEPGMLITGPFINQELRVVSVSDDGASSGSTINFTPAYSGEKLWYPNIFIHSPNPNYDAAWPGDKNFLEEKFFRLSYRFLFDDGEYSLIAPFSSPVFIPKQMKWLTNLKINDPASFNGTDWGYSPSWYPVSTSAVDPSTNNTSTTRFGGSGEFQSQLEQASKDTVVDWMINKVNNVEVSVPTPCPVNELSNKYKVKAIEILYKESDGLAIKSIDEIPVTDTSVINNTTDVFVYQYQGRKPIKVLPESESTRVYDKVPVRAEAQEVAGNRVIYGNFYDQHTPPPSLDFVVAAGDKFPEYDTLSKEYTQVSYPLHSLKQDRNYEVGVVLSDRYGRQSSVIPANVEIADFVQDGISFGGSSIYHPFRKQVGVAAGTSDTLSLYGYPNIKDWWGDSLKLAFTSEIPSVISSNSGYPGLYKELTTLGVFDSMTSGSTVKYQIKPVNNDIIVGETAKVYDVNGIEQSSIVKSLVATSTYTEVTLTDAIDINVPITINATFTAGSTTIDLPNGTDMTKFNTGMIIRNITGVLDPTVEAVYSAEEKIKISSIGSVVTGSQNVTFENEFQFINESKTLGWYSYKIVVKQNQQEYYNVYLPNLVNGEPYIIGETNTALATYDNQSVTATVSLLTDNVNKLPPDLLDIVPNQAQFKGSKSLVTPRVAMVRRSNSSGALQYTRNINQVYPKEQKSEIITIGKYDSLYKNNWGIGGTTAQVGPFSLWKAETNPPTIKFTNEFDLGNNYARNPNFVGNSVSSFYPAVYETEPVVSNIDIYWETPTTGLVSELNEAIRLSSLGDTTVGFNTIPNNNFSFDCRTPVQAGKPGDASGFWDVIPPFYAVNAAGANLTNAVITMTSVTREGSVQDGTGIFPGGVWKLIDLGGGQYKIQARYITWSILSNPGYFSVDDINNSWKINLNVYNNGQNATLELTGVKINQPIRIQSNRDVAFSSAWNVDPAPTFPGDSNGTRAWDYWQSVSNNGFEQAGGGLPGGAPSYYIMGNFGTAPNYLWSATTYAPGSSTNYSKTGIPVVLSNSQQWYTLVTTLVDGSVASTNPSAWANERSAQPFLSNGSIGNSDANSGLLLSGGTAPTASAPPNSSTHPQYGTTLDYGWTSGNAPTKYLSAGIQSGGGNGTFPSDKAILVELDYDYCPYWDWDDTNKVWDPAPATASGDFPPGIEFQFVNLGFTAQAGKFNYNTTTMMYRYLGTKFENLNRLISLKLREPDTGQLIRFRVHLHIP